MAGLEGNDAMFWAGMSGGRLNTIQRRNADIDALNQNLDEFEGAR